jgi:hypothetical protein
MRRSRTRQHPIDQLRLAIDCLPQTTRLAMLRGLHEHTIITGAYSARDGGICPMLAAHRCGGRTSLISFARAWDRFTRVRKGPRRATEREVKILAGHLEASLLAERDSELERAIHGHRQLVWARLERERTAEVNRKAKARRRVGPEAAPRDLDPAVTAQPATPEQPPAERVRPGDPQRSDELDKRHGWSWLRPFRRYDEYAAALERVEAECRALEQREADEAAERERELAGV